MRVFGVGSTFLHRQTWPLKFCQFYVSQPYPSWSTFTCRSIAPLLRKFWSLRFWRRKAYSGRSPPSTIEHFYLLFFFTPNIRSARTVRVTAAGKRYGSFPEFSLRFQNLCPYSLFWASITGKRRSFIARHTSLGDAVSVDVVRTSLLTVHSGRCYQAVWAGFNWVAV